MSLINKYTVLRCPKSEENDVKRCLSIPAYRWRPKLIAKYSFLPLTWKMRSDRYHSERSSGRRLFLQCLGDAFINSRLCHSNCEMQHSVFVDLWIRIYLLLYVSPCLCFHPNYLFVHNILRDICMSLLEKVAIYDCNRTYTNEVRKALKLSLISNFLYVEASL